jgi:hypothetical protein
VIVLGEIELWRRQDLSGDGAEPLRLQRFFIGRLRGLRRALLRLGKVVDAGAVLRADVVPLAHALGRVVGLPEHLQELVIADVLRVIDHEHCLVMPRAT